MIEKITLKDLVIVVFSILWIVLVSLTMLKFGTGSKILIYVKNALIVGLAGIVLTNTLSDKFSNFLNKTVYEKKKDKDF